MIPRRKESETQPTEHLFNCAHVLTYLWRCPNQPSFVAVGKILVAQYSNPRVRRELVFGQICITYRPRAKREELVPGQVEHCTIERISVALRVEARESERKKLPATFAQPLHGLLHNTEARKGPGPNKSFGIVNIRSWRLDRDVVVFTPECLARPFEQFSGLGDAQ